MQLKKLPNWNAAADRFFLNKDVLKFNDALDILIISFSHLGSG